MNTNKLNKKRISCTMHIEEKWGNGHYPFVVVNQGIVEVKHLHDYFSKTLTVIVPMAFTSMYKDWAITSSTTKLDDPMYAEAEKNVQRASGIECDTIEYFAEVERISDGLKSKLIITFRLFEDADLNN